MEKTVLEIKDLNITLMEDDEEYRAVHHVKLKIPEGKNVGIIGESGCGKSLTCQSIMGLLPPEKWKMSGEIFFLGERLPYQDVRKMKRWCGSSLALIAQDPMNAFDPRMTLKRHFLEAASVTGQSKAEILKAAEVLLGQMRLSHPGEILDSYAFQLSGGMLQRVMIALSLLGHPRLLIADEPTTALDTTVQNEILKLLKNLQMQEKMQVLMVSHDLNVIVRMADIIYVMYAGYVVESASAAELLENPLHPYTERLLASRPAFSRKRLAVMEGSPPGIRERMEGCPFAPRCIRCGEECRKRVPKLREMKEGHAVRCTKM